MFKFIISHTIHCVMHGIFLDYVRKVICYKRMHLLMLWHSILMNTHLLKEILVLPAKPILENTRHIMTTLTSVKYFPSLPVSLFYYVLIHSFIYNYLIIRPFLSPSLPSPPFPSIFLSLFSFIYSFINV